MSNEPNNMTFDDKKSVSYGAKLKAAREAIGLEQKDIAAQLRLGERIIEMLESGHYAPDVPITFIRGYIRSYSKLLQISEADIATALEPIQPALVAHEPIAAKQPIDLTHNAYFMQLSTYAIIGTLTIMLGLWWYNHSPAQNVTVAQTETLDIPAVQKNQENKLVTGTSVSISSSVPTASPAAPSTNEAANGAVKPLASASTSSPTHPAVTKVARADDDDDDDDEG